MLSDIATRTGPLSECTVVGDKTFGEWKAELDGDEPSFVGSEKIVYDALLAANGEGGILAETGIMTFTIGVEFDLSL